MLCKMTEKFEAWTNTWPLRFHPEKSKHVRIGKHNPGQKLSFSSMEKQFQKVEDEKDIGVTIDGNLSFNKHIC